MSAEHEALNAEWREAAERDATHSRICTKRVANPPIPPGLPLEAARTHPRYRYWLIPGAQCELSEAHEGPHRNGGLIWHDPPALFVGGKRIW